MNTTIRSAKARTFLALHTTERPLLLPNVWNPIGARILEARGYPAVATASAAVSAALGYADGERLRKATLLDLLERIAGSVDVPVSADIEAGYGASLDELRDTVERVVDAGIVGVNLEDSLLEGGELRSVDAQCKRLGTARAAADAAGVHLVINARVDSFVTDTLANRDARIDDCVRRAAAYVEAGADCVYPMGPGDRNTLERLRARIDAPLNVLGTASAEPLDILAEIGVNRVSFGPYVFRACLRRFVDIADELRSHGGYGCFADSMMTQDDVAPFLRTEREQEGRAARPHLDPGP